MAKDGWLIDQKKARGQEPPEWSINPPKQHIMDGFYIAAFNDLTTERVLPQSIPWSARVAYADRAGLSARNADAFVFILGQMDTAYLEWLGKNKAQSAV